MMFIQIYKNWEKFDSLEASLTIKDITLLTNFYDKYNIT